MWLLFHRQSLGVYRDLSGADARVRDVEMQALLSCFRVWRNGKKKLKKLQGAIPHFLKDNNLKYAYVERRGARSRHASPSPSCSTLSFMLIKEGIDSHG